MSREALTFKTTQLWNSKTKRKQKNRLLSSSTQKTTRVVIKLITVRDAHHVHVFTSRLARTTHRADLTIVRMTTREDSVQRASEQVCRVNHVNNRAAIAHVHNMVSSRAAISHASRVATVHVHNMVSRLKNSVSSHVVAISLASNRVAIVRVLSMVSLRKVVTSSRVATDVNKVAISRVAVTSRVATDVNRVAISHVATSRVAIRDVRREATVLKRRSRSRTIPMLSTP